MFDDPIFVKVFMFGGTVGGFVAGAAGHAMEPGGSGIVCVIVWIAVGGVLTLIGVKVLDRK